MSANLKAWVLETPFHEYAPYTDLFFEISGPILWYAPDMIHRISLDKVEGNRIVERNFHRVHILNIFSKI